MPGEPAISSDEPLVERIAEEILERQRSGERPTVEEYCLRYPEHAEELRAFLPALMVVEGLKPNSKDVSGTFGGEFEIEGKRREFIGDYRILRELGRGGMGVVYEAEQQSLGRHVALKVLLRSVAGDARAAKRFESEAKAAARMHHTNIVPVFDVGSDDQHLYYAMQLIQGQAIDLVIDDLKQLRNLRGSSTAATSAAKAQEKSIARSLVAGQFHQDQLLELQRDSSQDAPDLQATQNLSRLVSHGRRGAGVEGALDVTETLDAKSTSSQSAVLPGQRDMSSAENNRPAYFLSVAKIGHQTAEALAYAHARGIIHRDIKPSNLLLDGNGIVWITDFGLAKTGDHGMTHTGDILGTIRYMSPERFKGQCDVRADIYSLGLTLYELLTLQPAFAAADQLKLIDRIVKSEPSAPRTLDASVPRDLETIVLKCIDKDPRRRYQSADELCEDLERFIHDEPIKARRISLPERVARWSRRNKAMAASLAVVAGLLLIINIAGPLVTWRMARLKDDAIQAEQIAVGAQILADQRADEAIQSQQLADQRADAINHTLYFAKMTLAGMAAHTPGGLKRVAALTEEWFPEQGELDVRGWEWYYLRSLLSRDFQTLRGHSDPVRSVAWSPDGTHLASCSQSTIKIWDPTSARLLDTWEQQTNGMVAFSPDGTRLVSGGPLVRVWDIKTGNVVLTFPGSDDPRGFRGLSWSPDGTRIATSAWKTVHIWDATTGQPLTMFETLYFVHHLAWSPDSGRIAVGGATGGVGQLKSHLSIWNTQNGQQSLALPLDGNYVRALDWSPDGTRLGVSYRYQDLKIFDANTGEVVNNLPVLGSALSVTWSADGGRFAAGLNNRIICIWDGDTKSAGNEPLLLLQTRTGRRVNSLAWSPDATRIASVGGDNTVQIWDVERRLADKEESEQERNRYYANCIFWNSQGSPLAISAEADTFQIRNSETDQKLQTFEYQSERREGAQRLFSLSPDGKQIAARTTGGIGVWNTDTGQYQHAYDLKLPYLWSWCPYSKRLAAVGFQDDGLVRIFSSDAGMESIVLKGHRTHSHALAWGPDGKRLASGGGIGDHQIRIWDTSSGECLRILSGDGSRVTALSWSPDGEVLSSGTEDNMIYLWDPETGEKQNALAGHVDNVESIAWSSDGRRMASTGRDKRLIVWDPDTGLEAYSVEFPMESEVGVVSWSPDDRALAVVHDGRIKVLDAHPGYAEEENK
ncbi:MAG: protein kinase [bacterium]|nr:protein kinase [bacterium]